MLISTGTHLDSMVKTFTTYDTLASEFVQYGQKTGSSEYWTLNVNNAITQNGKAIRVENFKSGDKINISLGAQDLLSKAYITDLTSQFNTTTTAAAVTNINLAYTCKGATICFAGQAKSDYNAMKMIGSGSLGVDWNRQLQDARNGSTDSKIILR